MLLILTIPFLIAFYFLLIRPQQQRVRDHELLVASLEVGDDVVTAGGIHGRIEAVTDDTVEVTVAEGIVLTFARAAIARLQQDPDTEIAVDERGPDPEPSPDPDTDESGE